MKITPSFYIIPIFIISLGLFVLIQSITTAQPQTNTSVTFLDKMNCNDIMEYTDTLINTGSSGFTNDLNEDNIKSHAFDLRNQCMGSVAKYEMIITENATGKYRLYFVNETWVHLEMYHK